MLPTKKGITLNLDNWETFKKLIKQIDKTLDKKSKKKWWLNELFYSFIFKNQI
mgnify:CR=1 FL=1